ncbi:4'-phosphopantetheinyl transferase superfamily protein [Ammoniphilus sp. CFH 90114]|uniref:4'-phosphopantetheinyl transferase family protein n=1 Tax=Ammoniphilus sp. CFH 90114 TaxID=2493665 RepID=UPI00100ED549|nr:4'-phosphopantetheinyl transferase superfamily protein [Ammoniphilus sp. CFH 90114]RXT13598.1 4'-phosphopantetheinyl transferase superfamily protein [Ammoniphilus sp. CFH 90114]
MRIAAVNITRVDPVWCDRLSPFLSHERQERIQRYRFQEDRIRSLCSEMFIRVYAAKLWGLTGKQLRMATNSFQKPYIVGMPHAHFNVSHSGEWVVSAFGSFPVGIDVEQIRPIDLELAHRFFSTKEVAQLQLQPEEEKLSYFFQLWTLKESYVKAKGMGLSIPLQSFSFECKMGSILFRCEDEQENWCFRQYALASGYEMTICSLHPNMPGEIEVLSWRELLEQFVLTLDPRDRQQLLPSFGGESN